MKSSILLFSALFSVAFSQVLINLRDFDGNNKKNKLWPDVPYGIYASAHSDNPNLLSNIFIVTSEGKQISINDLKNQKLASNPGELEPYTIDDSAYLTTSLNENQLQTLNGVLYISPFKQMLDNNFHVMDVSNAMDIKLQGQGAIDSTYLFLNTNMAVNPFRSSIISQWKHVEGSSAYIYTGYPSQDTVETKNTQIFSNPMKTDSSNVFFPNVEKFTLTMPSFYLKTFNGGPNFRVEPGCATIDRTTTTAVTTTGLYMKQVGKIDSTITIFTKRDNTYSGSTGANIIGRLPTGGNVSVGAYDGDSHYSFSIPPNPFIVSWSTPFIGQTFQISSENGAAGEYYVQYFVFQGLLGTSTPPRSSTVPGRIETTTKSSRTLKVFLSLLVSFSLVMFM